MADFLDSNPAYNDDPADWNEGSDYPQSDVNRNENENQTCGSCTENCAQNENTAVKYQTRKVLPPNKRQCLCKKLGKLESSKLRSPHQRTSKDLNESDAKFCSCRMRCDSFETCNFCSVFNPNVDENLQESNSAIPDAATCNSTCVNDDYYNDQIPQSSPCGANGDYTNAQGPGNPVVYNGDWNVARAAPKNNCNGYCNMSQLCLGYESGICPYRPASRAAPTNVPYDSMAICNVCNGNGACVSCNSLDVCESCAKEEQPLYEADFQPQPSCDSMEVCSLCTKAGGCQYQPPSKTNIQTDPSCDSMGVCSVCAENNAAGSYDTMNADETNANEIQPSSGTGYTIEPSCNSMGVCSACASNQVGQQNANEFRPLPVEPSFNAMRVCSVCRRNDDSEPSPNTFEPPSIAGYTDEPSFNAMRVCSVCGRNEANEFDVNACRPSSRANYQAQPCDSMNVCRDCSKANAPPNRDDYQPAYEPMQERPEFSGENRNFNDRITLVQQVLHNVNYNVPDQTESLNRKLGPAPAPTNNLPNLDKNGNIVIRTAYVTIQPYDLPGSVQVAEEKFTNRFTNVSSQTQKQNLKFDDSAVTDSESNQSMRKSADFFRPSKQEGRSTKPSRAKSSLLIKNDDVSFDDLRRTSQSMTSMAKLYQKTNNKMHSVAAKIQQQNQEYKELQDELERTSDRKRVDRIHRQMETCKSNIRHSIKTAMIEQRRHKTEKFDPIPIAI